MLTKQERAAIAERAKKFDFSDQDVVYEVLVGNEIPDDTTFSTDIKAVRARIIDLCDTSNMLELPIDKDGEVIRIGNMVYDDKATEYKAVGYSMHSAGTNIIVEYGKNFGFRTQIFSDELTHKNPVTAKSISKQIRNILADDEGDIREGTYNQLSRIAKQLESLGGKDE
nr:MAG TPA: hypothetical protein [Caudoviricetes sp.]